MKVAVSIIRAMQELSVNDRFEIFAIDHRDVFVDMLKQANKYEGEDSVIKAKQEIIRNVNDLVSGYLIDPFYALPDAIINKSIPSSVGFMVHIENNDYRVESIGSNYCIENLSPGAIKRMGASAVKMFLYYNPDSKYAEGSEHEISRIAKECEREGIPFLLEPILYPIDGGGLQPEERIELLKKMIRRMEYIPISIYKINFPGSLESFSDEENIRVCREITDMLDVPWVIMSSDAADAVFKKQLELACKGGACGYVAGRAIWRDYVYAGEDKKETELQRMRERIRRFNHIVEEYASAWTEKITAEEQPEKEWYAKI